MAADVHLWRAYQWDYEEEYTIGIYSAREMAEDAIARHEADGSMRCPRSGIEHLLLDSEEDPDLDEYRHAWDRNEHTHRCPIHPHVVCACQTRCRPCENAKEK